MSTSSSHPRPANCHPSALVGERVSLGEGASIGPHARVSNDVKIGAHTTLGQNVFVARAVRVGAGTTIENNVSIYEGVEIEDGVFCGPAVVISGASNPRADLARSAPLRTVIRRGATLGANATIVRGSTLGQHAFVGAGAVVSKQVVPDYALMQGVPAKRVGWMSRHGHRLSAPNDEGFMLCPESGWRYREVAPGVVRCLDWAEDRPLAQPASMFPPAVVAAATALVTKPSPKPGKTRKTPASKQQQAVVLAGPAENIPMLDMRAHHASMRDELVAAFQRVLDEPSLLSSPDITALERDISAYCQARHGIAMSSGSDALLCAMTLVGVGAGDEVVTTPFGPISSCEAIARVGAKAVFVDIESTSFLMDPRAVIAAITPKTKAILVVHLFGQMVDVAPIVREAKRRNVAVIEAAAHALGAEVEGKRAGGVGDVGCFSFSPTSNLSAMGDAGMLVTNDDRLADRARLLRAHGMSPPQVARELGGNFRIDVLQAAVLRAKLGLLDTWLTTRRRNVERYSEQFHSADVAVRPEHLTRGGVQLPVELHGRKHAWHQYVIRSARRDALREYLTTRGIGSEVLYPVPLHLQPAFTSWGYQPGDFPRSERAAAEVLALPIYPELGDERLDRVAGAIARFCATR